MRGTSTEEKPNLSLLGRVLRYGGAGTIISVIYSLAVLGLVNGPLRHRAPAASALAFFAVLPLSYSVHRHFTFADAASDALQFARFVTTSTASLLVATGGMYAATELLRRSYLAGIALNWSLIPAINFLVYLVWVFRVGKPAPHTTESRS